MVKQLAARGEKVFATVRSRKSSATGDDEISAVAALGDVTIIEGIDITQDSVGETLKASALAGVSIDSIIHNAGSLNATRDLGTGTAAMGPMMGDQALANVTMDRMRACFELNTLGPLRVQQAILPQMKSPGGKVGIISTGMGSIGDNGSGGIYAYRTSKAAVNMVAKSMSCDLKDKGIAVAPINPGMVVTDFGGGPEMMKAMGGMTAERSVKDVLSVMDGLTMESTGKFMSVSSKEGEPPKEFVW
jgi:tubulin alpha